MEFETWKLFCLSHMPLITAEYTPLLEPILCFTDQYAVLIKWCHVVCREVWFDSHLRQTYSYQSVHPLWGPQTDPL